MGFVLDLMGMFGGFFDDLFMQLGAMSANSMSVPLLGPVAGSIKPILQSLGL